MIPIIILLILPVISLSPELIEVMTSLLIHHFLRKIHRRLLLISQLPPLPLLLLQPLLLLSREIKLTRLHRILISPPSRIRRRQVLLQLIIDRIRVQPHINHPINLIPIIILLFGHLRKTVDASRRAEIIHIFVELADEDVLQPRPMDHVFGVLSALFTDYALQFPFVLFFHEEASGGAHFEDAALVCGCVFDGEVAPEVELHLAENQVRDVGLREGHFVLVADPFVFVDDVDSDHGG